MSKNYEFYLREFQAVEKVYDNKTLLNQIRFLSKLSHVMKNDITLTQGIDVHDVKIN